MCRLSALLVRNDPREALRLAKLAQIAQPDDADDAARRLKPLLGLDSPEGVAARSPNVPLTADRSPRQASPAR